MGKTLGVNSGEGGWKHDGGVGGRRCEEGEQGHRLSQDKVGKDFK